MVYASSGLKVPGIHSQSIESCKDGMARLSPDPVCYAMLSAFKRNYPTETQHLHTGLAYVILAGFSAEFDPTVIQSRPP